MIAKKIKIKTTTSDCKNKEGAHPPHHPLNLPLNRPITLLALISKLFEKVVYQQIEDFPNKILSPKLCRFRKGHSAQHAVLKLLKNWQKCLDKYGVVGTVLMDLNKA